MLMYMMLILNNENIQVVLFWLGITLQQHYYNAEVAEWSLGMAAFRNNNPGSKQSLD